MDVDIDRLVKVWSRHSMCRKVVDNLAGFEGGVPEARSGYSLL